MALKISKKVCIPSGNWKNIIDSIMHKGDSKKVRPLRECPESIRNKYYVALSYLLIRAWSTKVPDGVGYNQLEQIIRISNNRWKQEVGSTWDEINRNLEKASVIEVDSRYSTSSENSAGKPFSMGYRLHPSWHDAEFQAVAVKYTQPKRPKSKKRLNASERVEKAHWDAIQAQLDKVSLDRVEARRLYQRAKIENKWNPLKILVHDIMIDEFTNDLKAVARTGRIYTASNRMASELRDALMICGMRTAEVDIVSSQPTLLATLYPEDSTERIEYLKLVDSRRIYETIAKALGETRNDTKTLVYRYIFGGRSARVAEWFQLNFPELATLIEDVPDKQLAGDLQVMESDVIVHDLMLNSRIDCVSIHDGLRCAVEDAEECKRLIIESFERRYGITPKVTIDYPADYSGDLAA